MTVRFPQVISLLLALLACRAGTPGNEEEHVVDSVLPIAEALDRFREDLREPIGLHGPESRDALVGQVIDALQTSDTLAFERLAVNRAEWAWLYYPTNVLAKPPYELPPALAWFQLQEANRTGVFRALREFGGQDLRYDGYECAAEPTVEGENRIWTRCTVTLARNGETPASIRLFASILERGGHFAILSYANDF